MARMTRPVDCGVAKVACGRARAMTSADIASRYATAGPWRRKLEGFPAAACSMVTFEWVSVYRRRRRCCMKYSAAMMATGMRPKSDNGHAKLTVVGAQLAWFGQIMVPGQRGRCRGII